MRITDHVHALKIPFHIPDAPGKIFERFVYLYLMRGSEICPIDSDVLCSYEILFDYLIKLGRKPEEISLLIFTHATRIILGKYGQLKRRLIVQLPAIRMPRPG